MTFTRPQSWLSDWSGIPEPDAAARTAIPAYLNTYGPARPETFDAWLTRGRSRKAQLRGWFGELQAEGVLAPVDVEGEALWACAGDLDELQDTAPSSTFASSPGSTRRCLGREPTIRGCSPRSDGPR